MGFIFAVLVPLLVVFLAGVGLGTFVVGAGIRSIAAEARAEFNSLRIAAEEKITEAENVIRQAKKAL
jgi:hypothetical protein